MDLLDWAMSSQTNLIVAFGGAITLGGAIVKMTPTKKDDAWFQALMKLIGRGK